MSAYSSSTSSSQFYTTRKILRDALNLSAPISYRRWMRIDDDMKAAALYVNFFDQITLAWYKTASVYSSDSDGVSTILQYLQKNVAKIREDRSRYTPAYVYRVAYNCLFCLCRDPNRHRRVYDNEVSNIRSCGDDTFDVFDTIPSYDTDYHDRDVEDRDNFIWGVFKGTGSRFEDMQYVASKLVGCDYNIFSDPDVPKSGEVETVLKHHRQKLDEWAFRSLKKRYSEGIVKEFEVLEIIHNESGTYYKVEYTEMEMKPYKGFKHKRCKFSKDVQNRVDDNREREILRQIRNLLCDLESSLDEE